VEKHIRQFGYLPELNGMLAVNLVAGSVQDFQKMAADYAYHYSDDMLEAIEKFKKELKPTEILATVIGLGAGEFYSSNVNGDWFSEETLLRIFKTFEEGTLYQHHVNRDPLLSLGSIKFATYNTKMHRVELLIAPDRSKAEKWVGAIERGEVVDVSFGYRTPYDRCSICSNRAGSRNEYCIHLKNQMNQILPDGRKVYAINPDVGKFFELSFVSKGAVPIAKIMQKVATIMPHTEFIGLSAMDDGQPIKLAKQEVEHSKFAEMKLAEFIKNVEGNISHSGIDPRILKVMAMISGPFSEKFERRLDPGLFKSYKIDEILGTLPITGIMPRLSELVHILSNRVDELSRVVEKLKANDYSYKEDNEVDYDDLYHDRPRFRFNESLFDLLSEKGFIRDRSWFLAPLLNRIIEMDADGPDQYASRLEKVSFDASDPATAGVLATGAIGYLYSKLLMNIGPTKLTGFDAIIKAHPAILPAIILGIGFAANSMRQTGRDMNPEYYINNQVLTPDRIVKSASTKDGMAKLSRIMSRWVMPFAAGQLGSAYLKVKRDANGQPLSPLMHAWANNPLLSSALMVGGANILPRMGNKFLGKFSSKDVNQDDNLFEKGSDIGGIASSAIIPLSYKGPKLMSTQLLGNAVDMLVIGKVIDMMSGGKPEADKQKNKNTAYTLKQGSNENIKVVLSDEDKGGI
jgi:hypothetical protein